MTQQNLDLLLLERLKTIDSSLTIDEIHHGMVWMSMQEALNSEEGSTYRLQNSFNELVYNIIKLTPEELSSFLSDPVKFTYPPSRNADLSWMNSPFGSNDRKRLALANDINLLCNGIIKYKNGKTSPEIMLQEIPDDGGIVEIKNDSLNFDALGLDNYITNLEQNLIYANEPITIILKSGDHEISLTHYSDWYLMNPTTTPVLTQIPKKKDITARILLALGVRNITDKINITLETYSRGNNASKMKEIVNGKYKPKQYTAPKIEPKPKPISLEEEAQNLQINSIDDLVNYCAGKSWGEILVFLPIFIEKAETKLLPFINSLDDLIKVRNALEIQEHYMLNDFMKIFPPEKLRLFGSSINNVAELKTAFFLFESNMELILEQMPIENLQKINNEIKNNPLLLNEVFKYNWSKYMINIINTVMNNPLPPHAEESKANIHEQMQNKKPTVSAEENLSATEMKTILNDYKSNSIASFLSTLWFFSWFISPSTSKTMIALNILCENHQQENTLISKAEIENAISTSGDKDAARRVELFKSKTNDLKNSSGTDDVIEKLKIPFKK